MALDDAGEAALKTELEALRAEMLALKEAKAEAKEEIDENAGKKVPEESPAKAKVNRDFAKTLQEVSNRIQKIEEQLNVKPTSVGLRPVLKVGG